LGCLVVHLALVIQHQIRLLQLHLASLKQSVERLVDDHYRVHQQLQKVVELTQRISSDRRNRAEQTNQPVLPGENSLISPPVAPAVAPAVERIRQPQAVPETQREEFRNLQGLHHLLETNSDDEETGLSLSGEPPAGEVELRHDANDSKPRNDINKNDPIAPTALVNADQRTNGPAAADPAPKPQEVLSYPEFITRHSGDFQVMLRSQPIVSLPDQNPRFLHCFGFVCNQHGQALDGDGLRDFCVASTLETMPHHFVLWTMMEQLEGRISQGRQGSCFVPMTLQSLSCPVLMPKCFAWLEQNRDLADHLIIELPMQAALRDEDGFRSVRAKMREYQIAIALHDAEALALDTVFLDETKCDYITIAADRLRVLCETEDRASILHQVHALKQRGIQLVADMVCTGSMVQFLQQMDLELARGDLFGRPRLMTKADQMFNPLLVS
ncbi:MAG: EAL domain-containing protein, partial [Pseudomonadota bacterium]